VDSFPGESSTLNRQKRKVLAVDAINTYFTEVDQILQVISQRHLQQVLCLLKQAYVRDIVDTIPNIV
jgi:hypothetical protein